MTVPDIRHGDCREILPQLVEEGIAVDAVVTDPPYHLTSIVKRYGGPDAKPTSPTGATGVYARSTAGFMGKQWDGGGVAFEPETWAAVSAAMKPGAHLLAFGGTRTFHRLACAIEDAGFEIRDTLAWLYGSGFPKSHDVSKAIDKAAGAKRKKVRDYSPRNPKSIQSGHGIDGGDRPWLKEARERGYHEIDGPEPVTEAARDWQGWGTALKPAFEPIILARKPLGEKTIAANVLKHGTGALNVDGCRIGTDDTITATRNIALGSSSGSIYGAADKAGIYAQHSNGRWPANVVHDGSGEVLEAFAAFGESKSSRAVVTSKPGNVYGGGAGLPSHTGEYGFDDTGTAARFFYTAKAGPQDRLGSRHPTIKPVSLIRWLVRLVTPPGGLVLDPFAGSGTTVMAALAEGMRAIAIEMEAESIKDIHRRIAHVGGHDTPLFGQPHKPKAQADFFERELADRERERDT